MLVGGSGIRPLLSIAGSVLEELPHGRIFLLSGNRRFEDVMFRDSLGALEKGHPERLRVRHVRHVLEQVFAREIDALLGNAVDASPCE